MKGNIYSPEEYFEHLNKKKRKDNWPIGKSKFTIFVGAGFSRNFNMPTWKEYAERKVNLLKKDSFNINHETFEEMKEMDPRTTLTIVSTLIDDDKKELEYDKKIFNIKEENKEKFKYEKKEFCEIFNKINASFVTTNYDNVLEDYFDFTKRDCYGFDFESDYILNVHDVFHIHGDIDSTSSHTFMVRNILDYYKLYFQQKFEDRNQEMHHNNIKKVLGNMFENNEILIVGYGLSEIEILRYILESRESSANKTISNVTILYMKRKGVNEDILSTLYDSLGINVIFLEIEELIADDGKEILDYSNLFLFLERLAKEFAVDGICYDNNNIYSLTRSKSFEIKEIIRGNDDINFMIEAIDKELFNINLWKRDGNIDGFVAINDLLLKFYKDAKDTKYINKIKCILTNYLTYDDMNIYKVIDLLVPIYMNYNLLDDLVKKLNCDLILPNLDQNKIDWIVSVYIKIIENSDIDNDINKLISVFINFVIMGHHNDVFQYFIEKNTLNKIIEKAVPVLSEKCFLNTLAVLDNFNKNIYEKVELGSDNYIKCIDEELSIKIDFCYVDVSDLLNNAFAMNDLFLRRNNYTKLLNEYLKFNKNKNIVLSLIKNDSIYYKKIGLYYLNECFDVDDIVVALSEIGNYQELLNNLSISCILTRLIDKCLNKLDYAIINKIEVSFNILKDTSSLEENTILIRSYNYLKDKLNINIVIPSEYSQLIISEGIVDYPAENCQNLSLISDDFIIQNFKKSIKKLNEIYLNNEIENVSWYQEKNYSGTLQRIKEVANNNFKIDIEVLDALDPEVIGDIIDLVECKDGNYNEVIKLLFSKLKTMQNDEQNINKQIKLGRGIDKYIDQCLANNFKINYNILSVIENIKDCRGSINLTEYNTYSGGHKYFDVYTLYINSITFILINLALKLYKTDENKIKQLSNVILKRKDESMMIAALGVNYAYFINKGCKIDLKNILDTDKDKEIFFAVFISSLHYTNDNLLSSVKFLFKHFINNELLCKDNSVYRKMGRIIYDTYDHCDIYDDLLDDIIKQDFGGSNNFISIILEGILSKSSDSNNVSKQKELLKKLREEMDIKIEKTDIKLKMHCLSLIICNKSELKDDDSLDFAMNIIQSFDDEDVKKHEYEFYDLYKKLESEDECNNKVNNLKRKMNKILQSINSVFLR